MDLTNSNIQWWFSYIKMVFQKLFLSIFWSYQDAMVYYYRCIPPKQSIFPQCPRLWVTTESVDLRSKVKPPTHPPHPHPSPGTAYQHSGTTGGPIRPPKKQFIPPKQSIFPECPWSWVTTESVGLKSKDKNHSPTHSIPISHQGPHFNTLGPWGATSPPNNKGWLAFGF